jgi:hypothetical protein
MSRPSMEALPNGRYADEPDLGGPKVSQMTWAPSTAAESDGNPPSVYVAPPRERRIVLPSFWQVVMSSLDRLACMAVYVPDGLTRLRDSS